MERNIVYVGGAPFELEDITYLRFSSDSSLLDGDIIVFSVDISSYLSSEFFQGMRCLDDHESFQLKRHSLHWRSELNAALTDGKTVICFLNDSPQVKAATGEVQVSGTGRNARRTRIVNTFEPYDVVPLSFGHVVRRSGERIKPAGDLGIIATYWHEFGVHSAYQAYIENFKGTPLLLTQTGGMVVGGILRQPSWKGTLIFIPAPDLSSAVDSRVKKLKEQRKTKPAHNSTTAAQQAKSDKKKAEQSVIRQFVAALVGLDKAAKSTVDTTPPPSWSQEDRFALAKEIQLQSQIDENVALAKKLQDERASLKQSLTKAEQLKWLLYEKGKPLEEAILVALKILGFHAENLQEEDSEFDAIMLDPEGARLIGEAEGKDDKAINVDKLDQLDRNLKEDFSRQDEIGAQFATGVLFGNAYRLTVPEARNDFFTPKCLLAAKRSHIGLVRTTDLFNVAQYLDKCPNPEFAEQCRGSIKEADGEIVKFPFIPG